MEARGNMARKDGLALNEKGQVLPAFVIGLLAMVGLAAGAVDISRHAFVATELQNVADAAASAAAKAAGNSGSAYSAANAIGALNRVNGESYTFASGDVVVGRYVSGAFTAGGIPANAVRVTARSTFDNIVAGAIGYPTSTIARSATATIVALGGGVPTLPIALGDDYWNNCITYGCAQPQIAFVPSPDDNAGWTSFFVGNTSTSTVGGYFPSPCGGGNTVPYITVGDMINVSNGQNTPLVRDVLCVVCEQHQNSFLVPIVKTPNNFNQSTEVVGFATVVVESINGNGNDKWVWNESTKTCSEQGNPNNALKTITVRSVYNANTPGPPGPGFYGSGYAQVVS